MDEISESLVRSVAKKLKHYIDVERREEGFDLSGSLNPLGEFHFGKGLGGTLHYNSLQDKHLDHYFRNPIVRKHLVEMGVVNAGSFERLDQQRKRSKSVGHKPSHLPSKSDQRRLLENSAKLLLSDPIVQEQNRGNYRKSNTVQLSTSSSSFTSSGLGSRQLGYVGSTTTSDSTPQKQRHSKQPTPSRTMVSHKDHRNVQAQSDVLHRPNSTTMSRHGRNHSQTPSPSHCHSRQSLSWSGFPQNTHSSTLFSTWANYASTGRHTSPTATQPGSTMILHPPPTIVYPPSTNQDTVGLCTRSSQDASTQTPIDTC